MEARQSAVNHVLNKTGRVECFRKVTHTQKKDCVQLRFVQRTFCGVKEEQKRAQQLTFKKEPKPYLSLCD